VTNPVTNPLWFWEEDEDWLVTYWVMLAGKWRHMAWQGRESAVKHIAHCALNVPAEMADLKFYRNGALIEWHPLNHIVPA
jgi:hypothetical protein